MSLHWLNNGESNALLKYFEPLGDLLSQTLYFNTFELMLSLDFINSICGSFPRRVSLKTDNELMGCIWCDVDWNVLARQCNCAFLYHEIDKAPRTLMETRISELKAYPSGL